MKYTLLRLIIGTAIKIGVAYALNIVAKSAANTSQLLDDGGLSDDARSRLADQLSALLVVEDFLHKLSGILGSPAPTLQQSELQSITDQLRRITDSL